MKKNLIVLVAVLMMLASCGTYQGYGAANGAYFGSLLGSAIGGVSGGPHGRDVGTIIGLAGGAVVGAAIGNAADKAANSADDRIDIDFGNAGNPEEQTGCEGAVLEIRNARFVTPDGSNVLTGGKQCDIVFDIYNAGNATASNVEPMVKEVSGNKRIVVSPGILVESLAAHKGLRYTAHVMAYKQLKDGTAKFTLSVLVNKQKAVKDVTLTVRTSR